jgi:transcriptional regulator with XRE-family HTH domain
MDFDLGERLRAVREMHGLSQRALAKRAGVTNGTISLIEQNRVSPSISSLKKVLDGIPMPLADFFALQSAPRQTIFFPRSELLEIAGGGAISYRQIGRNLADRALQILHEHYEPGADTGKTMLRHEAEEGGIVIAGRIEVTVGDQRRVLEAGDAYYFDSRLPHRFRNVGEEPCELVSVCTPPSF